MQEGADGTTAAGGVLRTRLRRAAQAGPCGASADPRLAPILQPASLDRIAAMAAARAAQRASSLPAAAEAVKCRGASLAELPELLPESALITVIEGAGDRLGVVALCPALLGSLIEMQAMGRVTTRRIAPRKSTRADATLAADFVNHLLGELAQAVLELPEQAALGGYRYASYLDDPRPLALMLEDGGFHSIRIDLRLGGGAERRGTLFIAVPGLQATAAPATKSAVGTLASPAVPDGWTAGTSAATAIATAVRDAPLPLVAVLCRRQITLRELRALKPGTALALPRASLDGASLETASGQKLARAKLGEADGFHALRLRGRDAPRVTGKPSNIQVATSEHPAPGALDEHDAHASLLDPGAHAGADDRKLSLLSEPPIDDLGGPDAFRSSAMPAADVLSIKPSAAD